MPTAPAAPRILLVSWTCGFPDSGTAETVRLRSFATGLKAAGADVSVHVVSTTAPGQGAATVASPSGRWRGIPFEYVHGVSRPVPGWLRRRRLEALAVWRLGREIVACGRASARTAVILFSPSLRTILPLRLACAIAGVQLVNERDEFPFVHHGEPGPVRRAWRSLYQATIFRLYDGHIVISTLLEEFVRARARPGSWIVRVPILVDADAFACDVPPTPGLVGYAGNLSHSGEVSRLVSAVSTIAANHEDVSARILGGGSAAETDTLEHEISARGLRGRVNLAGSFSPDEMPAQLCSCAALALPRAHGLFSSAGFPTKLGEYLATGRPVVVTATGDIPLYLHDGVEAFVVPADDPELFAAALERALYNPESPMIGLAGQAVARQRFDPATHMGEVLGALEESWKCR